MSFGEEIVSGVVNEGAVASSSNPNSDPFYKPPVFDHPLVWILEDVVKNRESDVSMQVVMHECALLSGHGL